MTLRDEGPLPGGLGFRAVHRGRPGVWEHLGPGPYSCLPDPSRLPPVVPGRSREGSGRSREVPGGSPCTPQHGSWYLTSARRALVRCSLVARTRPSACFAPAGGGRVGPVSPAPSPAALRAAGGGGVPSLLPPRPAQTKICSTNVPRRLRCGIILVKSSDAPQISATVDC